MKGNIDNAKIVQKLEDGLVATLAVARASGEQDPGGAGMLREHWGSGREDTTRKKWFRFTGCFSFRFSTGFQNLFTRLFAVDLTINTDPFIKTKSPQGA